MTKGTTTLGQKSEATSSVRPLRIAIALCFFAGLTTLGLAWLLTAHSATQSRPKKVRSSDDPPGDHGGFFYESVGHGIDDGSTAEADAHLLVAPPEGYTVELSAHTQQQEAENELAQLRAKGISAYYTPLSDRGRVIYRVRQGLYPSEVVAHSEAHRIAKLLGREPQVVKLQ